MADTSWAIQIPDYAPKWGDAMQFNINQGERNFEKQLALQEKQRLAEERKRDENYKFISGLGLEDIGNNAVDVLTTNMVGDVKNKLYEMAKNGTPYNQLQYEAQRMMQPIVVGHTMAKNKFGQINEGVKELGKQFTSGDLGKARELATVNMLKDYLSFDNNGRPTGYNQMPTDKNYLEDLTSFENLPKWNMQSGALEKHIGGLGTTDIGASEYMGNQGNIIKHKYKGTRSQFSEPFMDNSGKVLGERIKFEEVPIPTQNGTTNMKVLPQQQFEVMLSNPNARADFATRWDAFKRQHIGQQLPPNTEDMLMRKFAYDYLEGGRGAIDKHSFITEEKQVTPKAPVININNGDVAKKKQDDYDLLASFARTFNNPKSINVQTLTPVNIGGKELYDITGVFGNKLKTSDGSTNKDDTYIKGVYLDPQTNQFSVTFNDKEEAERLLGQKFPNLRESGDVTIQFDKENKDAMKSLVNSLGTAYKFKENERKRLMNMVQGVEPTKQTKTTTKASKFKGVPKGGF